MEWQLSNSGQYRLYCSSNYITFHAKGLEPDSNYGPLYPQKLQAENNPYGK